MTKSGFQPVDFSHAQGHPAIEAWCRCSGDRSRPTTVEVLQRARRKKRSRSIYRLSGVSTPSSTAIAKRCRSVDAERESAIYERILPHLPLAHPRLLGQIGGDSGRYDSWIFFEELFGDVYDSSNRTHRTLAGEWLADLHGISSRIDGNSHLASFGLGLSHYLEVLQTVEDGLADVVSNPALTAGDRRLLERIAAGCKTLNDRWQTLEVLSEAVPRTLVHGDFNRANMLVGAADGKPALLVFDWEKAGWGIPAMDLARFLGSRTNPDLDAYLSRVRRHWPTVDRGTVLRLGYVGEIFRWLDAVRWQVERLRFDWVEHPLSRLRIYEGWMESIRLADPWAPSCAFDDGVWISAVRL